MAAISPRFGQLVKFRFTRSMKEFDGSMKSRLPYGSSRNRKRCCSTNSERSQRATHARAEVFSDATGWSNMQIGVRLAFVVRLLGFQNTTAPIGRWWLDFEAMYSQRFFLVLRLAEELLSRGTTISEFYRAAQDYGEGNIGACLDYLDFMLLSDDGFLASVEWRQRSLNHSLTVESEEATIPFQNPNIRRLIFSTINTTGEMEPGLRERTRMQMGLMGIREKSPIVKEWWREFTEVHDDEPILLLILVRDLLRRRATLAEFYIAEAYSESNAIENIFFYMDDRRFMKAEAEENDNSTPPDF